MEKTEQDADERFGGGIFSCQKGNAEPGMACGQEENGVPGGSEVRLPYRNVPAYYNLIPQTAFSDGISDRKGCQNGTGMHGTERGGYDANGRDAGMESRSGGMCERQPGSSAAGGGNAGMRSPNGGMQHTAPGAGIANGRNSGMGSRNGEIRNTVPGNYAVSGRKPDGYGCGMQNMRQGSSGNDGRYGRHHSYTGGCPNDSGGYMQRSCCPCGHGRCPKGRTPNLTMLLVPAIAAMGALFLLFLATIFFMGCMLSQYSSAAKNETAVSGGQEDPSQPYQKKEQGNPMPVPDAAENVPGEENGGRGEYYGEIRDAVRTDLFYSVEWENYEYAENSDTVMIAIDYPVISGDIPNLELLNDAIAGEIDYFEEYYKEYSKYMLEDEIFAVYSEGYVTYMDENVMSVVFSENIYTDYWADSGLFCVNIDISNGVVLDNAAILNMDDEFAVDFRMRSQAQNGDVSALEYLTDQEVAYYLTHGSTGIIFFTPLGMEIGLNYGEDYVTVTYKDYKDFLLKY